MGDEGGDFKSLVGRGEDMGLQRAHRDGRESKRRNFLRFFVYLTWFKALSSLPVPSCLPREEARTLGQLASAEAPVHVLPVGDAGGIWSGVAPGAALDALASSKNVLEATGMDREALHIRLSMQWTAESALRDCK